MAESQKLFSGTTKLEFHIIFTKLSLFYKLLPFISLQPPKILRLFLEYWPHKNKQQAILRLWTTADKRGLREYQSEACLRDTGYILFFTRNQRNMLSQHQEDLLSFRNNHKLKCNGD